MNATGGTTNYAAILSGGNVGVNVLAPIARIQAEAAIGQDAIAGLNVNNTGVVGIDFGSGTGVLGFNPQTTLATVGVLGEARSNTVNSHGIWGQQLGVSNGSGYIFANSHVGTLGYSDFGNNFRSGVQGTTWATDAGNRTSGSIGIFTDIQTSWSSAAYKNSANNIFGLYYAGTVGAGAGYLANHNVLGIGAGGYGGVIGSWTRGEIMGQIAAGELFASYSIGNSYTSGYHAEIVELENERVAVYSMTGKDVKIYHDGTDKLQNGRKVIYIDDEIQELIGDNIPVVTVSPMGMCNGLYVSNITNKSFEIVELGQGKSDVSFSYILIAKRKDSSNKPELPEDLKKKDFDENMKGVMFNENYLERSAKPIWWDGKNVRFDELPEIILDKSKDEIKEELGIRYAPVIYNKTEKIEN